VEDEEEAVAAAAAAADEATDAADDDDEVAAVRRHRSDLAPSIHPSFIRLSKESERKDPLSYNELLRLRLNLDR